MTSPALAVVVLSYRNDETIRAAVESLLGQAIPLEIVVSHSGGGATPALLAPYAGRVRVLSSEAVRLPGAARNAGLAATRAPCVAFLAGDCTALPGWAAARLERHRRGAPAVASAMMPPASSSVALAAYLLQHGSRMPHRDCGVRHYHGLSYARDVLERYGPFPEDLVHGEDTRVNQRLIAAGVTIVWAPEVLTAHRYPDGLPSLLAERRIRGRRRAAFDPAPARRARLLAQIAAEGPLSLLRAARSGSPVSLRRAAAAAPAVAIGAVATALGVVEGPAPDRRGPSPGGPVGRGRPVR